MTLNKLQTRQTTTWITHALFTAVAPFLVSWGMPEHIRPLFLACAANIILGYFLVFREPANERAHREVGDYDTPDEQGITPRIDQWGDLIGPAAVALAYTLSMLIHYL